MIGGGVAQGTVIYEQPEPQRATGNVEGVFEI
jgi:hypothetical protein